MSRETTVICKAWLYLSALLWLLILAGHLTAGQTKLVSFEEDDKWGYKNASGQVVIKPQFVMANDFLPEGIGAVLDKQGWAYINKKGKIIIRPFVFDNGPDYFREGLARYELNGKMGFFDKRGRVVIRPQFEFAYWFQEGLSAICMGCKTARVGEYGVVGGGKWGYINKKGRMVIAIQFDDASPFEKGTAMVKVNGKAMIIDRTGRILRASTTGPVVTR
jgi:hypothetical protein